MKKKLTLAASILAFVGTGLHICLAAVFFSMNDLLYIVFSVLTFISLFSGLWLESLRQKMKLGQFDEKAKKHYLIASILGVVSICPTVLGLLAYFRDDDPVEEEKPAEEKPAEEKKARPVYKKPTFFLMIGGMVAALLGGFVAQLGETSFYSVKVSDFTLTKAMTDQYNVACTPEEVAAGKHRVTGFSIQTNESTYGVTMYVPKTASASKPAPTIFVIPGFTRTKATMAQYGIEFSRRGAVTFVIDPGCQGATTFGGYTYDEVTGKSEMVSSTAGANGAEYLVQYVYNNVNDFPFVNRDKIGVVGHSAGGGNAVTVAADMASKGKDGKSVISALYCSGYIKTSAAAKYKSLRCNAAMSYAYYDEGAYRYQSTGSSFERIAMRFINEVNGVDTQRVTHYKESEVCEKAWGSMDDHSYRIVHREKTNHCFEMYDPLSIANTTDFFRAAIGLAKVPGATQTWMLKEIATFISLISGFIFFIDLGLVLCDLPFFKKAVGEKVVRPISAKKKADHPVEKWLFWGSMILTGAIACLDYIPLARLGMDLFPDAAGNVYTFFFPARMINTILLWAVINGLIGLVIFFCINLGENLARYIKHKKTGEEVEYTFWKLKPLKINWVQLGVTIIIAAIVFGAYYGLIYLDSAIFHSDFRFMLISASTVPARYWVTWLMYFPLIFIFYISNSIRVNCSIGFEGWPEWKVMLVGALANSLGLCFILVINYIPFFTQGTVFYGYMRSEEVWLFINMVFGLIPMMFILPIINRIFYNKTNKPYLGALITAAIFVMMTLTASVSYIAM